jgi:hypothetical protein
MPLVSASLVLAFAFFNFHLAHPDNAFFARWILPTPETRCPGSPPTAGKPERLAPCSGVSVTLTPKGEVPGFISGRFLTTGLSLPLAEISAAGSLVATGPLNGAPELLAPAQEYSLLHVVQTVSGAHPTSYPMGTTGSFPGGKTAGE